jgi:hypothetical protein
MKMTLSVRLYRTLIFSLIGIAGLTGSRANAINEFKRYADDLWELEVTSDYFQTNANYLKSGGSYDNLLNGGSYQLLNTDFNVRWVPFKNWGIFAGTSLGFAQSNDGVQTRTNSQFSRALLGTDFVLFERGFKVIPEITATFPLAPTSASPTAVQTTEGDTEFAGRLIARFDFSRFHNQGNLGFRYRDGGRAALMTYGAGSEMEFHKSYLGAEIAGYTTAQQDTMTATPSARETPSFSVNGSSAMFNSVNPSLLMSNLWYRHEGSQNSLSVGVGTTLNGTNAAAGQQVFISWIHRFQKTFQIEPKQEMKPVLDRFKEETHDDVDQNLFRPAPPPPPVAPVEDLRAKKAKAAAQRRKKLQNELQQTEMQMELKLKKKKKQSPPPDGE